MFELLSNSENEKAVSLSCPHLLRYSAVAAIITNNCLAQADKLKWRESKYSDVFTQFVTSLYDEFNLEKAKLLIPSLVEAARKDVFLRPLLAQIESKSKKCILGVLCETEASIENSSQIFNDSGKETDSII